MKKICILILTALISTVATAQTAKSVLDKAAAHITVKEGVKANFKMQGGIGITSGIILIKGKKFHASTPQATVWFDGKTMWTYMKQNEEVNVSNPTEAQLQAINPYNFINLYKNGYNCTLNNTGSSYVVHLTSNVKDRKLLQGKKWTIFDITDLSKSKVADSQFRFNAKDFPKAEVIDLR